MSSISELERAVVEAAKACKSEPPPGAWRVLSDAVAALRAAEEAAGKPRLTAPRDCVEQTPGVTFTTQFMGGDPSVAMVRLPAVLDAIRARDAEWMAAIRKLPRHPAAGMVDHETIRLSDIEALVAETE